MEDLSFPRVACIYGSHLGPDSTDVELELLGRYDLLIGGVFVPSAADGRRKLNGRIARLREYNPRIMVLDFFVSAPYWPIGCPPAPPEEAFLHTVDGKRITGWPGTEMLNLSRPEAVEALAQAVEQRLEGLDVDGFFIDCMFGIFDTWAVEIETRKRVRIDADGDGKEDSPELLDEAWKRGKLDLIKRLRASLGHDIPIMVNAQNTGEFIKDDVNGNYLEDYVDYTISHNWDFKYVLDLYLGWCNTPHRPNCTTINATSGYWPEYEAPKRLPFGECCDVLTAGYDQLQRMRYGLGTALLGDGFYGFDLNTRWRGQHWWYPEFDAPLGKARGKAECAEDGTWRREFQNGFVIVNPQAHRVNLRFDRYYRDFSNGWDGQEFVIPARDARLFFPVGWGVPAR